MARRHGSGVLIGGWFCLGSAIVMMVVSLASYALYGAFFVAAVACGVVAVRRKRVAHGVALIVLSLLAPGFAFFSNIGHNRWADGFSAPLSTTVPVVLPKSSVAPPIVAVPAPVVEAQTVEENAPLEDAARSNADR